jgi:hypothetical protein
VTALISDKPKVSPAPSLSSLSLSPFFFLLFLIGWFPCLTLALCFVGVGGAQSSHPRYNVTTIGALLVAKHMPFLPVHSMRPALLTATATVATWVLDFVYLLSPRTQDATKALICFSAVGKVVLLLRFFRNDTSPQMKRARYAKHLVQTALRHSIMVMFSAFLSPSLHLLSPLPCLFSRRYIGRRLRLFFPHWRLPRRLMREIRARLLAIEWMQISCALAFLVLFIVSMTSMEYEVRLLLH